MVLPTLMVEGPDPVNAISKAFKLVHRNFWSNIGWVAVFLILLIVISLVLSGVILIPFSGSFIRNLFNSGNSTDVMELAKNPVFMILSAVVNALTFPLMPIFAFVLYFNGRATEEEVIRVVTETDEPKLKVEDLYAKPYSDDHPENPDNINK
jgi:predicted PurR-regulated permease PerM